MATFSRVPLQNLCPAALWTIQYVGPLPKQLPTQLSSVDLLR